MDWAHTVQTQAPALFLLRKHQCPHREGLPPSPALPHGTNRKVPGACGLGAVIHASDFFRPFLRTQLLQHCAQHKKGPCCGVRFVGSKLHLGQQIQFHSTAPKSSSLHPKGWLISPSRQGIFWKFRKQGPSVGD